MELIEVFKSIFPEEKHYLLKGNFHLQNDLGIDSLSMINLLLSIEDRYNIEIDYDSIILKEFETYESVYAFVNRSLSLKADNEEK